MKQENYLRLAIVVLIALAGWVMLGTHTDPATHRRVANFPTHYGLDIKGGVRATLQAHPEQAPGVPYDQATIQHILENRINSAGVSEAVVQARPQQKQFVIELPAVKNKDAIMAELGTTAQMTFYYFADVQAFDSDTNVVTPKTASNPLRITGTTVNGREQNAFLVTQPWNGFTPGQSFRDGAQIKADWVNLLAAAGGNTAGGTNTLYAAPAPDPAQFKLLGSSYDRLLSEAPVYLTPAQQQQAAALNKEMTGWNTLLTDSVNAYGGKPILTGADLEPSSSAHLGQDGRPTVSQVFNPKGAAAFADFTTQHTGEILGIVLDDSLLSSPFIKQPILDGQGEISGGFGTLNAAQSLSNLLNAGALPIPLEQVDTHDIEATLGVGAVTKSLIAGGVGLALVLIFMVAYYRLPGVLADIALLIYALFTLAIFKGGLNWLFPGLVVTLTLPGIAGFILSIGMAVDANILIFERLKEELRDGKALRPAIDAAFKRAFTAIRDSNICTCITCVILLSLGTAQVKGFALTLLIGVLVSLFSAITVTRTLLYLLVELFPGLAKNPALFGLGVNSLVGQTTGDATHKGLNIIGRRKLFYGVSLAIIVPGLIFLALGGLKPGIDFTGGTEIQVHYQPARHSGRVERAVAAAGFKDKVVQIADGGLTALVSVRDVSSVSGTQQNPVRQRLAAALSPLAPHVPDQPGLAQAPQFVQSSTTRGRLFPKS